MCTAVEHTALPPNVNAHLYKVYKARRAGESRGLCGGWGGYLNKYTAQQGNLRRVCTTVCTNALQEKKREFFAWYEHAKEQTVKARRQPAMARWHSRGQPGKGPPDPIMQQYV